MAELHKLLGKAQSELTYAPDNAWVMPMQRIGIEIECEGVVSERTQTSPELETFRHSTMLWSDKSDNSLRDGGREFVTSGSGLFGKDLSKAIEVFLVAAKKNGWHGSDRTGIHIHIDVAEMDTRTNFYFLCMLYAYFERQLFAFAGHAREGSIYCLPWHKAQRILSTIALVCGAKANRKDKTLIQRLKEVQEREKYSAVNLGTLGTYGTLEFRHLGTELNTDKLSTWINLLMCLKKFAKDSKCETTHEFLNYLISTPHYEVVEDVFLQYAGIINLPMFFEIPTKKLLYDMVFLHSKALETEIKWSPEQGLMAKDSPFNLFLTRQTKKGAT